MTSDRVKISDAAFFAAYMFVFMCSLSVMTLRTSVVADNSIRIRIYIAQQVALLIGFIIPSLSKKIWDFLMRRAAGIAMISCYAFCVVTVHFTDDILILCLLNIICSLCVGMLGAMVYESIAAGTDFNNIEGRRHIGISVGIGGMAAMVLQWLIQTLAGIEGLLIVLLTAACVYVIISLYKREHDIHYRKRSGKDRLYPAYGVSRRCVCLIVAICCMLAMLAYYEAHMNRLVFADYFYDWPRIFAAAGYLMTGLLYGRKNRGIVSMVMLCVSLIAVVINYLMLRSNEGRWIHISLFYLVLGSIVTYYNLMFMELSVRTDNPVLWASMGRKLDAAITVVFSAAGALLSVSDLYLLILYLIFIAGIIISMTVGGMLYMDAGEGTTADMQESVIGAISSDASSEGSSVSDSTSKTTVEERIGDFSEKYSLTPREKEVLTMLLTTECKNQEIADTLYISRRQLQNHISSIYQKTGANTRAGLMMMIS